MRIILWHLELWNISCHICYTSFESEGLWVAREQVPSKFPTHWQCLSSPITL